MIRVICDICGKTIEKGQKENKYKIKKLEDIFWEPSWVKMDVHEECWKDLCRLIRERQDEK